MLFWWSLTEKKFASRTNIKCLEHTWQINKEVLDQRTTALSPEETLFLKGAE